MRVSILTDQGDLHTIEVDSQMELENIKALLEADVSYFSTHSKQHKCTYYTIHSPNNKLTMSLPLFLSL